ARGARGRGCWESCSQDDGNDHERRRTHFASSKDIERREPEFCFKPPAHRSIDVESWESCRRRQRFSPASFTSSSPARPSDGRAYCGRETVQRVVEIV